MDSGRQSRSSPFIWVLLYPLARLLRTGDQAATIDRLFDSQHVKDLRFIVAITFLGWILLSLALIIGFAVLLHSAKDKLDAFHSFVTIFGASFGVFGLVLAWAYQVGSARLGVVDLFACEISTLCRVVTIIDVACRYVEKFEMGPPVPHTGGSPIPAHQFTSQESYFPVFENGTRDLQTLEARVVVNITEFYTYMKAFRDYLRKLAEIVPLPTELGASNDLKQILPASWHQEIVNAIYMLFLCLESARRAIADLVEFEPEYAERTVVILISELEAYRFLCAQFTNQEDMRHLRLQLREANYETLVPPLCDLIEKEQSQHPQDWEPAARLVPTLRERYRAVIPGRN
jgi:hypothetical protein